MVQCLVRYGAPGQTSAQAEAGLLAVAQAIPGLYAPATDSTPAHLNEGMAIQGENGEWALSSSFQWYKPTGATQTDPMSGKQVPVTAPDGYTYRVLQWNADPAMLSQYVTDAGGTMAVDPTTKAITITAGPVTMISPLPAGCPRTFG